MYGNTSTTRNKLVHGKPVILIASYIPFTTFGEYTARESISSTTPWVRPSDSIGLLLP